MSKFPYLKTPKMEYGNDCELLAICKELGATYGLCYKGASILSERCTPAQKQSFRQGFEQKKLQLEIQSREDERQQREEELQLLRDKQAVRRSWIQLLLAAILGGVCTKLLELLPVLIGWIKFLLTER